MSFTWFFSKYQPIKKMASGNYSIQDIGKGEKHEFGKQTSNEKWREEEGIYKMNPNADGHDERTQESGLE
jgi:hypothetical protein